MSEQRQSNRYDKDQLVTRHASSLLPAMATSAVIPRTLALIATISLVAIALYMSRPHGAVPAQDTGMHAMSQRNPHHTQVLPGANPNDGHTYQPSQSSSGSSSSSSSTVTVNGKNIPVPADGNLDQTIRDGDSTTTVHISSDGNATNSVNIQSTTSSSSSSGT